MRGSVSLDREQSAEQSFSPVVKAYLRQHSFRKPFFVTACWPIFHGSILGARRAASNYVTTLEDDALDRCRVVEPR